MSWLQDIFETIDRAKKVKEEKDYAKIMAFVYESGGKNGRSTTLEEIQEETEFSKKKILEIMKKAEIEGYIKDATTFDNESKEWVMLLDGKLYVEGLIEE